jgi:hypothetical protein
MTSKQSRTPLSKRQRFERAGRFPFKRVIILVVVVVLIGGGVAGYVLAGRAPSVGDTVVQPGGVETSSGQDGGVVEMVLLSDPVVLDDAIQLSLSEIKAGRIGGLLYTRSNAMPAGYDDLPGGALPILAYVSPSGKLVVASSLCEPCHSYAFHIEGDELVCNACFTRWNLDTLEGVSGGCTAYPPAVIEATVQGDAVLIKKSILESWEPRV